MAESEVVFLMGKYEAVMPADRWYADNHHWLKEHADRYRLGFTAYAVRSISSWFARAFSMAASSQTVTHQPP